VWEAMAGPKVVQGGPRNLFPKLHSTQYSFYLLAHKRIWPKKDMKEAHIPVASPHATARNLPCPRAPEAASATLDREADGDPADSTSASTAAPEHRGRFTFAEHWKRRRPPARRRPSWRPGASRRCRACAPRR